jgi:hypothetical protein
MLRKKTISPILIGTALAAGIASAQTSPPPAPTTQQQIDQLQQQINQLQQKKADEAAASNPSNASVTADSHGFTIKSGDVDFILNIGADIQVDNRSFFGVGSQSNPDTILLRRAPHRPSGHDL